MYKHIVREVYPNGMPMMIQGEVFGVGWMEEGPVVDPETCKLYPIIGDKVLPASPILDTKTQYNIAIRLTDVIHKN